MKNQYFGDVNDYRKYGLLRAFQEQGQGRLLVAWMLTPEDGRGDGERRAYLDKPDRWRPYDPDLFELLQSAPVRDASLIERSGLLPNTSYYPPLVPDAEMDRALWRQGLLDAATNVDLAFFDPDNGIEVPSKPVGRKGSSKYVFWTELEKLWTAGCSLLIYQHFPRKPREAFAQQLVTELARRTGAHRVEAFRTPHVLFLLAAQERHVSRFRLVSPLLAERWKGQIVPMGLANKPLYPLYSVPPGTPGQDGV
jgi:hypothetical protein